MLETHVVENQPAAPPAHPNWVRAMAWNIERGIRLEKIIDVLSKHSVVSQSDVLLLTELDYGMARSHNRFVAREIASALKLSFAFGVCYINLEKGSGVEKHTQGENAEALHGNAIFSRLPLSDVCTIALPNGKDKLKGKEKRLGSQRAVVATVAHPLGKFRAVSIHLDAHSSQRHRRKQMQLVLDRLEALEPKLPVLIGGDWNTTTYNSSAALFSILGYCRRVLMGIRNVLDNHYPYPDRWFERGLFRMLEERGYGYRNLNERGGCTLHYKVDDLAVNENLGDWVPRWCFWFIKWALARNRGECSLKLDWFAGKGIQPAPGRPPQVVRNLNADGEILSDHDPIVLDFLLGSEARFSS